MLVKIQSNILSTQDFVDDLARIRMEWQAATEGASLVEVKASVGLLLADVVKALKLGPDEQIAVLGEDLLKELRFLTGVD
jgi:hypothetical protein